MNKLVWTSFTMCKITTENKYKIEAMISVCSNETTIQIPAKLARDDLIRDTENWWSALIITYVWWILLLM